MIQHVCRPFALILLFLIASTTFATPAKLRQPADKTALQPLPPQTAIQRVVIKFHEGTHVRLRGGRLTALDRSAREDAKLASPGLTGDIVGRDLEAAHQLLAAEPKAKKLNRLFEASEESLVAHRAEGEAKSGRELADLDLYFQVSVPAGTTAGDVVNLLGKLNSLPSVEIAYAQPYAQLAAADIPPTTPNFQSAQGYLGAAPVGIDALYSWTKSGGKGQGLKIVDVEFAWQTTHEDMPALFHAGAQSGSTDHGTAVLGEMVSVDNLYGVTGISNQAQAGYESISFQATSSAVTNASIAGDIVLIELHTPSPVTINAPCECNQPQCHYIPMEYFQDIFDAIANATASGDIVVEAAGNGGTNLDDPAFGGAFNRSVRDSGAVLVGAGLSNDPSTPSCFTNWGSRVDVHGWGDSVATMGFGDLFDGNAGGGPDINQLYTGFFNGTSSASPIVTGAVADLKGVALANGLGMTPAQTRQLLVATGTPSPSSKHIGSLPDLRAAISALLNQRPNLLKNANFENGVLNPWFQFPSTGPGVAAVESCCGNQTPGGTWDGYIQPQGQYIEMAQKVTLIPGKKYRVAATVSTKGMTANIEWFSDADGDHVCASTSVRWPAVTRLTCDFTVPFGTKKFNVGLSGTGAAGNIWAFSDDWSLTDINDL
jgi:serine protease